MCAIALIGSATLLLTEAAFRNLLLPLVAFAAGTLLAGAFFHSGSHPKEAIFDEASKWRADLLVIGSHGLGAVERFLLGSVSEAVGIRATCPLEIVRQQATQIGDCVESPSGFRRRQAEFNPSLQRMYSPRARCRRSVGSFVKRC